MMSLFFSLLGWWVIILKCFFNTMTAIVVQIKVVIQGVSLRNGLYELALTDKDMQVRFGLKMILECWDREFLGTTTIFKKSNISWPQQPPTERVPDISEKLDFWWSIPWKGVSIGHIGARDNLTIKISNFLDEMRLLRSLRTLRLLRLLRSLRLLRF